MTEKIAIGEGNFKAEFRVFVKERGTWETLAEVWYEDLNKLLVAITLSIEVRTESYISKLKEIEARQRERKEILRALKGKKKI